MEETLVWIEPEYKERDRSNDWFWALGVIAVSSAVLAIIYDNYLFAVFIVIAAIVLGFFAVRKPGMIEYRIDAKGLSIGREFYPYEKLVSFTVLEKPGGENLLLILSKRPVVPLFSIPLGIESPETVRKLLASHIKEEKHTEPTAHKIMDYLGF